MTLRGADVSRLLVKWNSLNADDSNVKHNNNNNSPTNSYETLPIPMSILGTSPSSTSNPLSLSQELLKPEPSSPVPANRLSNSSSSTDTEPQKDKSSRLSKRLSGKFNIFSRRRSNSLFEESPPLGKILGTGGVFSPRKSPVFKTRDFAAILSIDKPIREGYLNYKMNKTNRWVQRYCVLDSETLHLFKSHLDQNPPQKIALFCSSVKMVPQQKKDFHFQIFTAEFTHEFSSTLEKELSLWFEHIQEVTTKIVNKALSTEQPMPESTTGKIDTNKKNLLQIWNRKENQVCADCDSPNPKWASINLGIFVCIECSGGHRKLGTHISQVRSVDLDIWEASQVEVLNRLGNKRSNGIFEYLLSPSEKPNPTSPVDEKVRFVRRKYELLSYRAPATRIHIRWESSPPDQFIGAIDLFDAIELTLIEIRGRIPAGDDFFQFVNNGEIVSLLQEADISVKSCYQEINRKVCLVLRLVE